MFRACFDFAYTFDSTITFHDLPDDIAAAGQYTREMVELEDIPAMTLDKLMELEFVVFFA